MAAEIFPGKQAKPDMPAEAEPTVEGLPEGWIVVRQVDYERLQVEAGRQGYWSPPEWLVRLSMAYWGLPPEVPRLGRTAYTIWQRWWQDQYYLWWRNQQRCPPGMECPQGSPSETEGKKSAECSLCWKTYFLEYGPHAKLVPGVGFVHSEASGDA